MDPVDAADNGYLERHVFDIYQTVKAALVRTVTRRKASHGVLRQVTSPKTYPLIKIKATSDLLTHRGGSVSRPVELLFACDSR